MLETALAFTATTTVSIRMHRLAVAIMEPTSIDRRRNYGAGIPWSSTRCIEMHFGINMHFPYATDEGRNVTKRDKRGGTI